MLEEHKKKHPHILLLGGTKDAHNILNALKILSSRIRITTSFAGRTKEPNLPEGSIRIGGFGGVEGLISYIKRFEIDAIIDATHPFAYKITKNAYQAAQIAKIHYWRFSRPAWKPKKGDVWHIFYKLEDIAAAIPPHTRCFLALGRQHLDYFHYRQDVEFYARMIEPTQLCKKFYKIKVFYSLPLSVNKEKDFLKRYAINTLICRNSGGKEGYGKIEAARKLNLPVFLLEREQEITPFYKNWQEIIQEIQKNFCYTA